MITAQCLQVLVPVITAGRDVVDVRRVPAAYAAVLAVSASVFVSGEDVIPALLPVGG